MNCNQVSTGFFSRMLKTPPGVAWPVEPVLTIRTFDQDAIAIHVHNLLRHADQHDERAARGKLRPPPILARRYYYCSARKSKSLHLSL